MYLGIGGGITIDVKHVLDSEPLESTFPATVYQQGSELIIHVANAAQIPESSSIEAEGWLTISTMPLFALWFLSHSLVVFHALTRLLNVEWHQRLAVGVRRNLASALLRNRSWSFEATRIAMYGALEAAFSGKLPTCSAAGVSVFPKSYPALQRECKERHMISRHMP
ncbi:hypothetical protein NEUTE1DRAFT_101762 [Neurospora tetrasperma FGSC 2508]|uniref:Uncharacterized protein n=1 Tax=Neurospora tetrasperma (strain FGSC 2508 / ATCC MYA-4615 / P0657) TaxID=510951 RepID=F8MQ53_NEUT8|nr:uncharacterized protein NEUTE1DRAFT_101762 [Neurospora tetrasperma FGSC 2508]EGO56483.1 hypothetical protein NEUTE1DRAFT_101762 [Neurospora tetrasperma FGSC 2508]